MKRFLALLLLFVLLIWTSEASAGTAEKGPFFLVVKTYSTAEAAALVTSTGKPLHYVNTTDGLPHYVTALGVDYTLSETGVAGGSGNSWWGSDTSGTLATGQTVYVVGASGVSVSMTTSGVSPVVFYIGPDGTLATASSLTTHTGGSPWATSAELTAQTAGSPWATQTAYDGLSGSLGTSPWASNAELTAHTGGSPWATQTAYDGLSNSLGTSPWASSAELTAQTGGSPWATSAELTAQTGGSPWATNAILTTHTNSLAITGASLWGGASPFIVSAVSPWSVAVAFVNAGSGDSVYFVTPPYAMTVTGVSLFVNVKTAAGVSVAIGPAVGLIPPSATTDYKVFDVSNEGTNYGNASGGTTAFQQGYFINVALGSVPAGASTWTVQLWGRRD